MWPLKRSFFNISVSAANCFGDPLTAHIYPSCYTGMISIWREMSNQESEGVSWSMGSNRHRSNSTPICNSAVVLCVMKHQECFHTAKESLTTICCPYHWTLHPIPQLLHIYYGSHIWHVFLCSCSSIYNHLSLLSAWCAGSVCNTYTWHGLLIVVLNTLIWL